MWNFQNENKRINSIKENNEKISFCYAGNIGEAHDENFLKNFIDNLNPKKHILTLSLYGSKSKSIIEYCNGKNGIKIIEFIKKEDLNSIDIHIVSLKKNGITYESLQKQFQLYVEVRQFYIIVVIKMIIGNY